MPITIVDYVKSIVGDKPAYHAEDFSSNGVAMMGGCELCYAVLAGYNAYPSTSGSWRCEGCIGDTGFATVAEFKATASQQQAKWEAGHDLYCPACGEVRNIRKIRVPDVYPEGISFECGDCGAAWSA